MSEKNPMKIKDWLDLNKDIFSDSDLRYILKDIFSVQSCAFLPQEPLGKDKLKSLETIKKSYRKGIPLAYILGKEEFFGHEFEIEDSVLIPRKETEIIVESAIELIEKKGLKTVLDIGCGSGNIAISIKKYFGDKIEIASSDISHKALRVAKKNIEKHNSDVGLVMTDLFCGFKYRSFDIIVSNPPYVEPRSIKGPLRHEPRIALCARQAGLEVIESILWAGVNYLKRKGFLLLEIGYNQKEPTKEIIDSLGFYEIIDWIKDYSDNWRGVILKTKEKYG